MTSTHADTIAAYLPRRRPVASVSSRIGARPPTQHRPADSRHPTKAASCALRYLLGNSRWRLASRPDLSFSRAAFLYLARTCLSCKVMLVPSGHGFACSRACLQAGLGSPRPGEFSERAFLLNDKLGTCPRPKRFRPDEAQLRAGVRRATRCIHCKAPFFSRVHALHRSPDLHCESMSKAAIDFPERRNRLPCRRACGSRSTEACVQES